jgi:hypothetical protein
VKRVWTVAGVCALTAVAFDVLFPYYSHPESWWHTTPGFDLVFGFAGCAAIVLFSKSLGKFVSKPEDYYERDAE